MDRCVIAFVLFCVGCAASNTAKRSETGKTPPSEVKVAAVTAGSQKLFTGSEGLAVVQIKLEDGTYLMQIKGSESPVEGEVLPYERRDNGRERQVFVTTIGGREFWVLHRNHRWGRADYRLYAPRDKTRQNVALVYDEKKSKTIDAQPLVQGYREILADGSLSELQRFKRGEEEGKQQESIAKAIGKLNAACGSQIELIVDWKSIDDETLKKLSIAGYCGAPVAALEQLCKSPGAKQMVSGQLKQLRCTFGAERAIELSDATLSWTVAEGATNSREFAKKYLAERAPWRSGKKPAEVTYVESSRVCSDGKSVYVGLHPERDPKEAAGDYNKQIFFGDGKTFKRVPRRRLQSNDWFYDPRFFVASHNANFRGFDYRYHSRFTIDEKKGTCRVTCGDRNLELQLLANAETARLMSSGSFTTPKGPRVPYGLARDRRGTYYYVDRGPEKDSRDYRLYKGPAGRLRSLKMTNVVADSEGDVFSTRSGSLRLVLERPHSFWIKSKRRNKLINVPIRENLQLIYNELGIYLGQRFNTPCDLL